MELKASYTLAIIIEMYVAVFLSVLISRDEEKLNGIF